MSMGKEGGTHDRSMLASVWSSLFIVMVAALAIFVSSSTESLRILSAAAGRQMNERTSAPPRRGRVARICLVRSLLVYTVYRRIIGCSTSASVLESLEWMADGWFRKDVSVVVPLPLLAARLCGLTD